MKIAQIVKDILGRAETAALEDKLAILKQKWLDVSFVKGSRIFTKPRQMYKYTMWNNYIVPADPTPNKQYLQWIIQKCLSNPKWYKKPQRQYQEDLHELTANLALYDRLKITKKLPDDYRDINRISGDDMLSVIIIPIRNQMERDEELLLSKSGKAKAEEQSFYDNDGAILVHNSADLKVAIPLTHEASMYFGKNTRWCTTMKDDPGTFYDYAKEGDLYIILHKPTNRRWQFHFPDRQYMNEEDHMIEWHTFMQEPFWTELINIDSMQTAANENGCVPFQKKYTNAQANKWWDNEVESIADRDNHIAEFHGQLSQESRYYIMLKIIRQKYPFINAIDYIEQYLFPNMAEIPEKYKIEFIHEVAVCQGAGNLVLIPILKLWPNGGYPIELLRILTRVGNVRDKGPLFVRMKMTNDMWMTLMSTPANRDEYLQYWMKYLSTKAKQLEAIGMILKAKKFRNVPDEVRFLTGTLDIPLGRSYNFTEKDLLDSKLISKAAFDAIDKIHNP